MFSKSAKPPVEAPPVSTMPAPPPAKRPTGRSTPSIISSDLLVQGSLLSQGDLQIDGSVEGDIRSMSVTIGEKAVVKGEVVSEEVVVRGRVEGRIRGRKVQLDGTAVVIGDILQETLVIAAGATFEGSCRRTNDPLNVQAAATPTLSLAKPHAVKPADEAPQAAAS